MKNQNSDWREGVIKWLKEEKKDGQYVGDYNGEYDLSGINLDGWFNLENIFASIIQSEIDKAVKEREEELLERGEGLKKYTEDTVNEDGGRYGYCNFCGDHISQHNEKNMICGCDYYNQAITDYQNLIKE